MNESIICRAGSPMVDFAVGKLREALSEAREREAAGGGDGPAAAGASPAHGTAASADGTAARAGAPDAIAIAASAVQAREQFGLAIGEAVRAEGFELRRAEHNGRETLFVLAQDDAGAMYGTLELAERISRCGSLAAVPDLVVNARFPFRAVKFNLPWSSYRQNECFELQKETVRDLAFWQRFLDMMAENRYNVLTLWNLHPFPYMLRTEGFPLATPLTDEELADWKQYWTALFRMAKERGIETYMIDWNIIVSEAFRQHYDENAVTDEMYHYGDSYTSEAIKQYVRTSMTQLIDEYPDLTGFGIALGERMNDMTPQERQDWINDVYLEAYRTAKRPFKLIHRAPFSVDPSIAREAIERSDFLPEPVWVEVKFNWSHAYSTPELLLTHGGSNGMDGYWNPPPANYKITWMVRNEDFFTLRWAQPDFVRAHIAANGQHYVGGYYVGSECFIPGKDYSHKRDSAHMSWDYAFEKHWLYYMLWGRLLYDPSTPDAVFADALARRHGAADGRRLLEAYAAVCGMPMALASFYSFTWDFTLYAEGFLATDQAEYDDGKAFISLQDLIDSRTFDPSYLSIRDYADLVMSGQSAAPGLVTPPQLAERLENNARRALSLLGRMEGSSPELECERADVEAWAHLSLYFADKLRAAACFESFRRTGSEADRANALQWLRAPHAAGHWERLVAVTSAHYDEQPLMHLGKTPFSWALFLPQVYEDIALVENA